MPALFLSSLVLTAAALASAGPAKWDFEQDRGGWKGWGTTSKLGDTSRLVTLTEAQPRSGKRCLCIDDHFETGNPYAVFVAPVDPERSCVFSGYLRGEQPGPPGRHVWIMPVNRAGAAEQAIRIAGPDLFAAFRLGETWQRFECTLPPMGPEVTHVYLAIRPAPVADPKWRGRVWVDDVRFGPRQLKALNFTGAANAGCGELDPRATHPPRAVTGEWRVAGVSFTILDPEQNEGKCVVSLRPDGSAPGGVALPVEAECDWLYLLHAAVGVGEGGPAGSVVWEYPDGSACTTPVVCGEEVGDFGRGRAVNAFREPWRAPAQGQSSAAATGSVFVAGLSNPKPDREVKRVLLQPAQRGQARWVVLAASAGTGNNLAALARAAARDERDWVPFALGLETADKPLLDLSFLLDAPAGKHGFVQSRGGHFVFEDGTPARFVAVNLHSHQALLPTRQEAEQVARTLARYGVNLVRLHLMESVLPAEGGASAGEAWDRFDYLVKCLKDRGIYIELDSISGLSAGRRPAPDAFEGAADYPPHRAWWAYHPQLRELGQAWAGTLLTHRNAHTGNRLADEPAVAMMMLVNEQSVFFDWQEGAKPTPPGIRALFDRRFNEWLLKKFGGREGLERAWRNADGTSALQPGEDPAQGTVGCWDLYARVLTGQAPADGSGPSAPARLQSLMLFLQHVQEQAHSDYLALLRGLGVRVPVAGTNILCEPAEIQPSRAMGFTAQNMYYEHVKRAGPALEFPNIPEVLCDPITSSSLVHPGIAAAKLNTLPVVATEHDTMWPQEWRSTHNLSVYSMAAFQDWDALFWYCYMGGFGLSWADAGKMTAIPYPTVQFNDPASAGLLPAAALLFHRRDIAPARNLVQVVYDDDLATATGTRMRRGGFPWNYLTWISRVEGVFGKPDGRAQFSVGPAGPRSLRWEAADLPQSAGEKAQALDAALKRERLLDPGSGLLDGRVVSDTGEIVRDWRNGVLRIDTPRTQALSGFPGGEVNLKDVSVRSRTPFVTIIVQSLDEEPVATARRLLLTAVARVENDCDVISYQRAEVAPNGAVRGEGLSVVPGSRKGQGGHARLERVEATVSIAGGPLTFTAIAADGSSVGAPVPCAVQDGRAQLQLGGHATIWYLLERP